ncbi:polysaccharide deacetylase family protein [Streptomyces sp. A7024]|uniref:Polysaccharide deacetylase family protein n=1 Tax=Streptomyces coryli TaxID=1128680 RepID=A0A6G4TTM4_9ACTN|nr:polysaccharide deacetylase family protein [Streptomyces coryli]NGN63335.1 polysaccharide deacetylase family protein [Streptomyces coryli]
MTHRHAPRLPLLAAAGACLLLTSGAAHGSENRLIRTDRHVVALTFNAAWTDTGLDRILAALDRRDAPATFFLTGRFAERNPRVVRKIAAAGHGLGNHSHSHPRFKEVSASERRRDAYFRFPYSQTSPAHIREVNRLGFAALESTTDTGGWKGTKDGMNVGKAVNTALDALRPNAILQMHVGTSSGNGKVIDAEALPRILDAFAARGYRVIDLRCLYEERCRRSVKE